MAPLNEITPNGITIQTYLEIVDELINGSDTVQGVKQIYGSDINVDSNTPDGQLLNIFALSKKDVLDLIVADYDSKDPDQAVGTALDAVAQLCGIFRKGGTYTETDVTVTTDRGLNLVGLDNPSESPYTIADGVGNQFQLIESASLISGANVLRFRAKDIGLIQVLPNTLIVPVTIVIGVVSVNNPTAASITGENQETDAQFRARRQRSVAVPSQGFLEGLRGGLLALEGMVEAAIYENNTSSLDSDDVPGHSIWVIVDGGTDDDVAETIYTYRNAGAGMKGGVSVTVEQVDGTFFVVYFDRADQQDLYIELDVASLSGSAIDSDALKEGLVEQYVLGIYEAADITSITALVKEINPDIVVQSAGVSADDVVFVDILRPTSKQSKFVVVEANITINVSASSSSSCRSSSSSSCRSSSSSSSCRSSSSSSSSRSSSSSSCRSSSSSSSSSSSA